jgi:hypothetical protein
MTNKIKFKDLGKQEFEKKLKYIEIPDLEIKMLRDNNIHEWQSGNVD